MRFDASQGPRIVGPSDGKSVDLGSIGARMMAWTEETGGGFSLVEHPMPPRRLAPVQRVKAGWLAPHRSRCAARCRLSPR